MAKEITTEKLLRSRGRFFRFYVILAWCLVLATAIGLWVLYRTLDRYEEGRPTTQANAITKSLFSGDTSSLAGLDELSMNALAYSLSSLDESGADCTLTGRSGGTYHYRVSHNGKELLTFTLAGESGNWSVTDPAVSQSVTEEYNDTQALCQAELVLDRIAQNDYTSLWPLLPHTGFSADTEEFFTAFMAGRTPDRSALSVVRNDADGIRGYDIALSGSLFGHISLTQTPEGAWQVSAFTLNQSLKDAYILSIADSEAGRIASWFDACDASHIMQLCIAFGYPAGDESKLLPLIRNAVTGGSASCSLYAGSDDQTRSYRIASGETHLADVTFTRGEHAWAISDFSTPVWTPCTATIVCQASSTVSVDGTVLTSAYEVSREKNSYAETTLLAEHPDRVTDVTYRLTLAFEPESVTATDWQGNSQSFTREGNTWTFAYATEDALVPELTERFEPFSKIWGYFSLHEESINSIRKYVRQGSTAYQLIYNGDYMWTRSHKKNETTFSDFAITNVVRLDEHRICCDMRYVMSVVYTAKGGGTENYDTRYRLYMDDNDGVWMIYSFTALENSDN